MAKPRVTDNVNRFRKYAAVYITKALEKQAELIDLNVKKLVKDKLQETYVNNVRASYTPRSVKGQEIKEYNESTGKGGHKKKLTYRHTNIFANSIYTKIDGRTIKVMIKDEKYPNGASTTQVYKWLTEGTKGSKKSYPYIKHSGNDKSDPNSYSTGWARNYPTPAHLFEQHTKIQMKGFLDSLENDIKNGDKDIIQTKYNKYLNKSSHK